MLALLRYDDDGTEKCVGCDLCEAACPSRVISVISAEVPGEPTKRYARAYYMANRSRRARRPACRAESGSHTHSVSATLYEQIATQAHEHYERRIRQGPLDDSLQAEQEILGQQNTRAC